VLRRQRHLTGLEYLRHIEVRIRQAQFQIVDVFLIERIIPALFPVDPLPSLVDTVDDDADRDADQLGHLDQVILGLQQLLACFTPPPGNVDGSYTADRINHVPI